MLVRTPRACLGWGPVSRSGSGMAIAWLMGKARVKEVTGEGERGKRLLDSNISKNIVFYATENQVSLVYTTNGQTFSRA